MTCRALLCASVLVLGLAGTACGGDEGVTVYLAQRLGPDGPHGQLSPVLMPVERERRPAVPEPWQAVLELRVGPAPDERARGFVDTLHPSTRLVGLELDGGVATVELAGVEPDLRAAAAIVYSLTETAGVERVRMRLGGRRCCVYRHDGTAVDVLSRAAFRGWTGEPCRLRREVPCRG